MVGSLDELKAAIASGVGGGSFGKPMVYWGQIPGGYQPSTDSLRSGATSKGPRIRSIDESAISFYTEWSDEERTAWANRMYAAGFTQDPGDIESAFKMWSAAVDRASMAWMNGQHKLTPWQAMDLMEGANAGLARRPKTTVDRTYATPNTEDAAAMVTAVFKNAFGRAPNDAELSRYRSMLIKKFESNPTVTTRTTDLQGNTTTRSQQGYTDTAAQYDALQRAQADPEYGAYQAATTYYNALVGALGAPG